MLKELQHKQEKLMGQAMQLQQDMQDFNKNFSAEIHNVLDRTPLIIHPPRGRTRVDIDAEESPEVVNSLPPPLQPQRISTNQIVPLPCQVASSANQKPDQGISTNQSEEGTANQSAETSDKGELVVSEELEERPKDTATTPEAENLMEMHTPVEEAPE